MIWIFTSIVVLFFVYLALKQLFGFRLCILCASVFSAWVLFLVLFWLGKFGNLVLISALVGGSIVGFYYLVEKKVKQELLIFRLPFYLSLIFVGFLILGQTGQWLESAVLILALWLIFGLLYFCQRNDKFKTLVGQIINCCKNW
ncbi:MAG: hypothetical protein AB1721_00310 [Patescibacteria group bacterium]